jgi:DNA-directed RNA polymerase subunit beta
MWVVKNSTIEEAEPDEEVDYEMLSPNHMWSTNINMIPTQGAVQGARLFYGSRFFEQARSLVNGEPPLVQTHSDDHGKSWEAALGPQLGAVMADEDSDVESADDRRIVLNGASGRKEIPLFHNLPYNRKSLLRQSPVVKAGDKLVKGQAVARSNYTDDKGAMNMGLNARMALVPYKGWSMDDAIVVSDDFARRLTSDHGEIYDQEYDDDVKGGFGHYTSLFPKQFTKDQLAKVDPETGVVRPGVSLDPGDPIFLATRPRTFSSAGASLGNLSRTVRMSRSNAAQTWDADVPGQVTDVVQTKKGWKAVIQSLHPAQVGDKVTVRSGGKGTISKILDKDKMPRTMDGQPLDVLLNQLSLGSRTNSALPVEMWMGKIAKQQGKPMVLPAFNAPGQDWMAQVREELDKAGLSPEEEIYDPEMNRKLDRPVSVGNAYVMKLVHTSADKVSSRGQAGYDNNLQPQRGGGLGGSAKRLSGLESHALLSSGAYATLREGSTLRGQANDDYWRTWREGGQPRPPGKPFVWSKFMAMLQGTGMNPADKGKGVLRLGPMTDKHVDELKPVEVRNPGMVDLRTMEPDAGGLFDTALSGTNKWGVINLPRPLPNPAYHDTIRQLLGLKKTELDAILAGEMDLPEHLR